MQRLNVIVERDNARSKVPTSVFDVELPVLRELHANVTVVDTVVDGDPVEDIDAEDLYGRLALKYKAPDAIEAFTRVYPTVHSLANAIEDGVGDGSEVAAPRRRRSKAKADE